MKKSILLAAAVAAAFAASGVQAQSDFPNKPIRMVVSFPPGGSTDLIARVMAPIMTKHLGQQVVVENKGGAGGNIAVEYVARSAPDGYTVVFSGAGALGINSVLYRNLSFDPVKDLTPVSLVASSPFVLVAPANSPYKDIREVVADAKANPGKLSIGHGGQGTVMHLASELFNELAGVKTVLVPYKGTGPATNDAMAGQIPLAMSDTPSSVHLIKEGRLKALAVTTTERSFSLPDVPTLEEVGIKGYEAMGWFGIAARAGTPEPIIKRLNEAITAALKDPEVIAKARAAGADATPTTPQGLRDLIARDMEKWGKIVQRAGIKLD